MAQQSKQMKVGARKGCANHSVKLVLLTNDSRHELVKPSIHSKYRRVPTLTFFVTHNHICSLCWEPETSVLFPRPRRTCLRYSSRFRLAVEASSTVMRIIPGVEAAITLAIHTRYIRSILASPRMFFIYRIFLVFLHIWEFEFLVQVCWWWLKFVSAFRIPPWNLHQLDQTNLIQFSVIRVNIQPKNLCAAVPPPCLPPTPGY